MTIIIDREKREALLREGISTLHGAPFSLPDDCEFEPPCSLKWMGVHHSLSIKAFSYAVSGYYFSTKIARYTSIGESVQIGRGSHPISWASTSPVFYQRHEDVVGFAVPAAQGFTTNAPYIPPKSTMIGNDVYIGHGAFISQGLTIGDGAVIGAQSVVTKNVPNFAVVAGSPAVVKKMRFPDTVIERMSRVAWWRFAFWDLQGAPANNPEKFLDIVEERIEKGISEYKPNIVRIRDLFNY